MEALRGWGEFLRLGLPGAAMICMEWLSFEIAVLILGSIDEIQLAINAVVVNLLIVVYMVSIICKTLMYMGTLAWEGGDR